MACGATASTVKATQSWAGFPKVAVLATCLYHSAMLLLVSKQTIDTSRFCFPDNRLIYMYRNNVMYLWQGQLLRCMRVCRPCMHLQHCIHCVACLDLCEGLNGYRINVWHNMLQTSTGLSSLAGFRLVLSCHELRCHDCVSHC